MAPKNPPSSEKPSAGTPDAADHPGAAPQATSGAEGPADKQPQPPHDQKQATSSAASGAVDRVVQLYGDMIFDLCESVLWSPINAQLAFRSIIKAIRRERQGHGFVEYERAWVLQITCARLLELSSRHVRRLTPSEQIQLDSAQNVTSRLKQFDSYFHRLGAEDQILLLLRDKYTIPYPEIASALGLPEGNIKLRRAHALRSLEEWLWDAR